MFAAGMGFAAAVQQWIPAVLERQPQVAVVVYSVGVVVLAGTDAGQGAHGRIVAQIELLALGGLDDAIGAASWEVRRYLGLPGIAPGAPAVYVLDEGDPCGMKSTSCANPVEIVLDGHVVARRDVRH